MGLPSQKRTKSSKRRRASHFALKKTSLGKCPQCGKPQKPHHACAFCGSYKGKTILTIKTKKKTLKQKEQERKSQKQNKKSKKTDA
ncbi:MAG TPA: 50S ribosomal protein L32 [bacterium]|nr:50S ribosomal protein L32 [bacterium]HNS33972.1 50S ribosomal protein L32 [bacterium]